MVTNLEIISITIISTFIFAFSSVYGKFLIKETGYSYHFILIQFVITFIILSGINGFLIVNRNIEIIQYFNQKVLLIVILSSLFAFLGFVALFKGFEVGDVSVGGVFLSSRVFVSIPLAFFVFGELFPYLTYFWITITIIGALLVSWSKELSIKDVLTLRASGANYFIITLMFWGVSNAIVSELNNIISPFVFLFLRAIAFLLISVLTYPFFNKLLADNKTPFYSARVIKHTIAYAIVIIMAQTGFIFALGESLTLAEGIGVLEGVFTFILVLGLSISTRIRKILDEPLDSLTLGLRFIGVFLALIGTINIIIIIQ